MENGEVVANNDSLTNFEDIGNAELSTIQQNIQVAKKYSHPERAFDNMNKQDEVEDQNADVVEEHNTGEVAEQNVNEVEEQNTDIPHISMTSMVCSKTIETSSTQRVTSSL